MPAPERNATEISRLLSQYLAIKAQLDNAHETNSIDSDGHSEANTSSEQQQVNLTPTSPFVDVSRTLTHLTSFLGGDPPPEEYATLLRLLPEGLFDAANGNREWFWSADAVLAYHSAPAAEATVMGEIGHWMSYNLKYELLSGFKCGGGVPAGVDVYYGKVKVKSEWYASPANRGGDRGTAVGEEPQWKAMVFYSGDGFVIYDSVVELLKEMLKCAEERVEE